MNAIEPGQLGPAPAENYQLIDTRQPEVFAEGFIGGSISIPYNEQFIQYLQEIASDELETIIVADEAQLNTIVTELNEAGILKLHGYVKGGFEGWKNANGKIDMLILIEPDEFAIDYQFDEFFLIDLRSSADFSAEHVEDSENIELNELERVLPELETNDRYYLYGSTLQEAVTGASIFKSNGFQQVRPVAGDYEAVKQSGVAMYVQKKKDNTGKKFSNN